jgi:hypothetical protein
MIITQHPICHQAITVTFLAEIAALDARIEATPGDPSLRVSKTILTIELEWMLEDVAEQMCVTARRIAAEHFALTPDRSRAHAVESEPRHAA